MAANPSEINYRSEYGYTMEELGVIRTRQRRQSEAEALFRGALAIRNDVLKQKPKHPENWTVLGRIHLRLGQVQRDTGRNPEAESEFREAAAAYKRRGTIIPMCRCTARNWPPFTAIGPPSFAVSNGKPKRSIC